jgi:serine/threonine protein kinase
MRVGSLAIGAGPAGLLAHADRAVRDLRDRWRDGEPALEHLWSRHGGSVTVLAALVKADLACRFERGERPAVADYLERFPDLRSDGDRVLSLIYEEFCLREEQGERPDPDGFCQKYSSWRESLESQLRYHHLLSRVSSPPAPPVRFPEPGEFFEEFRLESLLGQGGAGRVYLARDESLAGRKVALKVSLDRGPEPYILGRLDHAHIVSVHSVVFQSESRLRGLCMPYRPGLPLDQVIRRLGPARSTASAAVLREVVAAAAPRADENQADEAPGWAGFPARGTSFEAVAWIIASLARALAYAHAQGVLHRDVKPANVLLTVRDGPQLLDFNLAHDPHSPEQAELALRGGTLPYMAPEQLEAFLDPEGWGRVGAAADLYSLGLVMLELLTGLAPETPDPSLPMPRAIRALLDRRALALEARDELPPGVPRALQSILARCLAFSTADRYTEARDLADDLQRFLDHRPLRYATNSSVRERTENWIRRNGRRAALAGALLFGSGLVLHRPIENALVPAERRPAFLAAVRDYEEAEYRAAVQALEAQVAGDPQAPLPRFYLSAALGRTGADADASRQFATLLTLPRAEPTLVSWGSRHRRAALDMQWLGRRWLQAQHLELADAAFRAALAVDPTLRPARQGAADVHERRGEFARAHAAVSALIDEAGRRTRPEDVDTLIAAYLQRARIAAHWGADLLRGDSEASPLDLRRRCDEALADLDRRERLIAASDRDFAFATGYARAEVLIVRAEAAARSNQNQPAALADFRAARRLVEDQLEPAGHTQRSERLRLAQRLNAAEKRSGLATGTVAPRVQAAVWPSGR